LVQTLLLLLLLMLVLLVLLLLLCERIRRRSARPLALASELGR
jgi:hypothetical protein